MIKETMSNLRSFSNISFRIRESTNPRLNKTLNPDEDPPIPNLQEIRNYQKTFSAGIKCEKMEQTLNPSIDRSIDLGNNETEFNVKKMESITKQNFATRTRGELFNKGALNSHANGPARVF